MIDSALKRASAAADQFTQMFPPAPSGTIGAAERAIVVWAYAGLTYGAPAIPDPDPIVDAGQYARTGFSETTYNRLGADETTYNRTGASDSTYARP